MATWQIVCLLMILRAEVNVGYEEQVGQLASLNGEPVKSLRQLKEQVEAIESGRPASVTECNPSAARSRAGRSALCGVSGRPNVLPPRQR